MQRLVLVTLVAALFGPAAAVAGDLAIGDVRTEAPVAGGPARVRFTVAWKNGWRNDRNHDAAWVFVKVRVGSGGWAHGTIISGSEPRVEGRPSAAVHVPADRIGLFVFPSGPHRGEVQWTTEVVVATPKPIPRDPRTDVEARVFGVEMVHVPEGPFTVGDPGPAAQKFAGFFRSGAAGEPDGLVRITSDGALPVGTAAGALNYRPGAYAGDQKGPVPAEFPKGYRAFYAMKYELRQGQYADFLNLLPEYAAGFRAVSGVPSYQAHRGTIRFAGDRYVADRPQRPANFLAWSDAIAWADWAGLRPMTELEYEKAARGPGTPLPREFPWGTTVPTTLRRLLGDDGDLAASGDADEARLSDETRPVLGASYFWVMDLAGSLWERVITVGSPAGRSFKGTHGDGQLTGFGRATNEDWPREDDGPGGYGYRGGGNYAQPGPPSEFLPHSPIGYRPYGSWGEGPRAVAYGFRAARTAQ